MDIKKIICKGLKGPLPRFLSLLEKCYSVKFISEDKSTGLFSAQIIFSGDPCSTHPDEDHSSLDLDTFIIAHDRPSTLIVQSGEIVFSDHEYTPFPFKGKTLDQNTMLDSLYPIPLNEWDTVIAKCGDIPIWSIRRTGGKYLYKSAMDIPKLEDDLPLFKLLSPDRYINVLPLIDFLRRITGEHHFKAKNISSCFMIDDPNLHFSRYGFINYRTIATESTNYGYHVAFAIIPIDLYHASRNAIEVFEEYSASLSLVVHGNNHVPYELALNYEREERAALIAQALQRVKAFEKRYAIPISRAMVAPRGAFSEVMIDDMIRYGFGAACVSYGSLQIGNRNRTWVQTMGTQPITVVQGLPIYNRFRLLPRSNNAVLLAAYFGRPILPTGHHYDLKDGYGILRIIAEYVNNLGNVRWTSIQDIIKNNYIYRLERSHLTVRLLSRHAFIEIPEAATSMRFDLSRLGFDPFADELVINEKRVESSEPIKVIPGSRMEAIVCRQRRNQLYSEDYALPKRTPFKVFLRRIATEARDMIQPIIRAPNK